MLICTVRMLCTTCAVVAPAYSLFLVATIAMCGSFVSQPTAKLHLPRRNQAPQPSTEPCQAPRIFHLHLELRHSFFSFLTLSHGLTLSDFFRWAVTLVRRNRPFALTHAFALLLNVFWLISHQPIISFERSTLRSCGTASATPASGDDDERGVRRALGVRACGGVRCVCHRLCSLVCVRSGLKVGFAHTLGDCGTDFRKPCEPLPKSVT